MARRARVSCRIKDLAAQVGGFPVYSLHNRENRPASVRGSAITTTPCFAAGSRLMSIGAEGGKDSLVINALAIPGMLLEIDVTAVVAK